MKDKVVLGQANSAIFVCLKPLRSSLWHYVNCPNLMAHYSRAELTTCPSWHPSCEEFKESLPACDWACLLLESALIALHITSMKGSFSIAKSVANTLRTLINQKTANPKQQKACCHLLLQITTGSEESIMYLAANVPSGQAGSPLSSLPVEKIWSIALKTSWLIPWI